MSEEKINFLKSLDYLSKDEIRDLLDGYTSIYVLLDCQDLEFFEKLT